MNGRRNQRVMRRMKKIAIACQGGGSHTAFTAGVLKAILAVEQQTLPPDRKFEIVALSGTSGGAICALLAWRGLVTGQPDEAIRQLDDFWKKSWPQGNASSPFEPFPPNHLMVLLGRLLPVELQLSPYDINDPLGLLDAQAILRRLLEKYVDKTFIEKVRREPPCPTLIVGAVNVLSGEFRVFSSDKSEIGIDAVVASAAIPTLMKAVEIDGAAYWDGLFSQNPPLKNLLRVLCSGRQRDPDRPLNERDKEIWIIRINPERREKIPRSTSEIVDRRNELAGNLSLEQEKGYIETINRMVRYCRAKDLPPLDKIDERGIAIRPYQYVRLNEIAMPPGNFDSSWPMDAISKLDRNPDFLARLMAEGERQAELFLAKSDALA